MCSPQFSCRERVARGSIGRRGGGSGATPKLPPPQAARSGPRAHQNDSLAALQFSISMECDAEAAAPLDVFAQTHKRLGLEESPVVAHGRKEPPVLRSSPAALWLIATPPSTPRERRDGPKSTAATTARPRMSIASVASDAPAAGGKRGRTGRRARHPSRNRTQGDGANSVHAERSE